MNHPFHVIKDPVHGTMQFTERENQWIKPFIDSSNLQRLRHIRQMGMGDIIFPGAIHTRFSHSLGCCYVASQIANKIGLPEAEKQLVMIACLLHDVGHGPFSHTFEGIFYEKQIRHEDWTPYFLTDFRKQEFFDRYNARNLANPLAADNFDIIARMIMHEPVKNQLLADIVSSQLDADRLDYLLRDNHFCGVQYGQFDLRWLLHCLMAVHTENGLRLGITHKGIGAVEHYLIARRLMVRNIYQLQKKIAFENFFVRCFSELADQLEGDPCYHSIKQTRMGQFLSAMQPFTKKFTDQAAFLKQKQTFLETYHPIYRELRDYDVFMVIELLAALSETKTPVFLAKRLQHRIVPKIMRLDHIVLDEIEPEIATFKETHPCIKDWQLSIIRTPHRSYSGEMDPIWVKGERGEVEPISAHSFVLSALSDRLEHSAFLCIDKEIYERADVQTFLNHLTKFRTHHEPITEVCPL